MPGSIFEEISAARRASNVRCGACAAATLESVAATFGLASTPETYSEIDAGVAGEILRQVLHRHLAYQSTEMMSAERAAALADGFLAEAARPDARYFSNVDEDWGQPGGTTSPWSSATRATFDWGVLVVSAAGSACLWVEDED